MRVWRGGFSFFVFLFISFGHCSGATRWRRVIDGALPVKRSASLPVSFSGIETLHIYRCGIPIIWHFLPL